MFDVFSTEESGGWKLTVRSLRGVDVGPLILGVSGEFCVAGLSSILTVAGGLLGIMTTEVAGLGDVVVGIGIAGVATVGEGLAICSIGLVLKSGT